jgi:CDP-6-deoxy-D-xylo-4-hexulose-3-dehydrase
MVKIIGKYSDITTNSFYASHIINGAGTGGIACFND